MAVVKLMSYNIQGHAARGRADHVPKLAEVITSVAPDIVGLQEVHRKTRGRSDQAEQLASMTGMNMVFGLSTPMEGGSYGNAVLTRGEVRSTTTHPLGGSGEPRTALQCDITIDGAEFAFFVTHLAAWGRLLHLTRLRQIERLSEIISGLEQPHVVVGDFNVSPGAAELRLLQSKTSLRQIGEPRETTFPMTRQRLDYILCDPHWQEVSTEIVRRGPSDHWGIVATLNLTV